MVAVCAAANETVLAANAPGGTLSRARAASRIAGKGWAEIAEASDRVVDAMNESRTGLDALRRDVVRLSDDVRGEVGMSRAIELARGGASKQEVADALAYRSRRQRLL